MWQKCCVEKCLCSHPIEDTRNRHGPWPRSCCVERLAAGGTEIQTLNKAREHCPGALLRVARGGTHWCPQVGWGESSRSSVKKADCGPQPHTYLDPAATWLLFLPLNPVFCQIGSTWPYWLLLMNRYNFWINYVEWMLTDKGQYEG